MKLRRASTEDARAIADVHIRARQAAYRDFFPLDYLDGLTVHSVESLWRSRLGDGTSCLVAEVDGRIAGQVRFGPSTTGEAGTGEVLQLHVHPDFWRRRLGSELLAAAVRELSDIGYRAAELDVYEPNEQARRFYEHEGWHWSGESRNVERGGALVKQLRYRRSLP